MQRFLSSPSSARACRERTQKIETLLEGRATRTSAQDRTHGKESGRWFGFDFERGRGQSGGGRELEEEMKEEEEEKEKRQTDAHQANKHTDKQSHICRTNLSQRQDKGSRQLAPMTRRQFEFRTIISCGASGTAARAGRVLGVALSVALAVVVAMVMRGKSNERRCL